MKRSVGLITVIALAALAGALWWFKLERGAPQVEVIGVPNVVGRTLSGEVLVRTAGRPGLRWIEVRLVRDGQAVPILSDAIAADGPRVNEKRLPFAVDLGAAGAVDGPATLEVSADTYAWHLFGGSRGVVTERALTIDATPPRVTLLTTQHNMRLGGSAVAVFTVSPDATDLAVVVDQYEFPAVRGYFADPTAAVALFAVPQDLSTKARPRVRARDGAGNISEVELPVQIAGRSFPERLLPIDDAFLQRKVPEILSKVGKPVPVDLVQGYLLVNREVRRESEAQLDTITATSAPRPLWTGVFHRQSNAAPMSAFADRRSYIYKGDTIDHQTHLGFDLASLKRAPVEAAQAGVVTFAGYLGIYGDTVVIDHGLGLASVYGHLSSLGVQVGQRVESGAVIGQSGETGLAGGDHLHFSIMLRGTHVDPVEWWDAQWLRDHVTAALSSQPSAAPPSPPAAAGEDGADDQDHS